MLFWGGDENDALTTPLPKGRGFTLDLGKHLSVPVELGVAFQGSQQASLALAGSVCDSTGFNCPPITSVPANIVSEQAKISRGMWFFKAYPIVSVEFGIQVLTENRATPRVRDLRGVIWRGSHDPWRSYFRPPVAASSMEPTILPV